MAEIALFPLSQVVLPQGQMQLRIFEPRYIRMVKEACSGQRDFAIALLNPYVAQEHQDRIFPVATRVHVADFHHRDDGLLGIVVTGIDRVRILSRWQEQDKLHVGKIQVLQQWPSGQMQPDHELIKTELQQVFIQNPQLAELYKNPAWQDPCWLAQRWIEILTMQPPLKYQLMAAENAEPTLTALQQWLQQEN